MARMRTWLLATALVLTLCIAAPIGCGGSGTGLSGPVGGGTGGGEGPTPSEVSAGQVLFGRVSVQPMVFIEPQNREAYQASRSQLEAQGYFLTPNAEILFYPESPGSSWLVTVGDEIVAAGPDGSFQVTVPDDPSVGGTISHPTDTDLTSSKFAFSQLSIDSSQPKNLIIPIAFKGGCGMGDDQDLDVCGGGSVAPRAVAAAAETVQGRRYEPIEWVEGRVNPYWGVRTMARGTYPPPDEAIIQSLGFVCPQRDGFLNFSNDPTGSSELYYVGSTCDQNAIEGACVNENARTDLEYRAFMLDSNLIFSEDFGNLLTLDTLASEVLGVLNNFYPPNFFSERLTPAMDVGHDGSCLKNHKGRFCGDFALGDVSLDVGTIFGVDEEAVLHVSPGQKGSFVVHNNGVFGITDVKVASRSVVHLSGENFTAIGLGRTSHRIFHFETDDIEYDVTDIKGHNYKKKRLFRYVADQTIDFEVDQDAQPGDERFFTFIVDNREVRLKFKVHPKIELDPEEAAVDPSQTGKLENASVTFKATGAEMELAELESQGKLVIYQWSVSGDAGGRLSAVSQAGAPQVGTRFATSASSVQYLTNDQATPGQQDTVKVDIYVVEPGRSFNPPSEEGAESPNGGQLFGSDTSVVTMTSVTIDPEEVTLEEGQSQRFTASALPPPGATLSYEWTLEGGGGTLSATTGSAVTFEADDDVPTQQKPKLSVVVFVEVNGQKREFGRATAEITVEPSSKVRVTPKDPTIEAGSTVTLNAEVSQGEPGAIYRYEWSVAGLLSTPNGYLDPNGATAVYDTSEFRPRENRYDTVSVRVIAVDAGGADIGEVGTGSTVVEITPKPGNQYFGVVYGESIPDAMGNGGCAGVGYSFQAQPGALRYHVHVEPNNGFDPVLDLAFDAASPSGFTLVDVTPPTPPDPPFWPDLPGPLVGGQSTHFLRDRDHPAPPGMRYTRGVTGGCSFHFGGCNPPAPCIPPPLPFPSRIDGAVITVTVFY